MKLILEKFLNFVNKIKVLYNKMIKKNNVVNILEDSFTIHVVKNLDDDPIITDSPEEIKEKIEKGLELKINLNEKYLICEDVLEENTTFPATIKKYKDKETIEIFGGFLSPNQISNKESSDYQYSSAQADLLPSSDPNYDYQISLSEEQQILLNRFFFSDEFDYAHTMIEIYCKKFMRYVVTDVDYNFRWPSKTEKEGYDYESEYLGYRNPSQWWIDAIPIQIAFDPYDPFVILPDNETNIWIGDGWTVYFDVDSSMIYFKKPENDETDYSYNMYGYAPAIMFAEEQRNFLLKFDITNPFESSKLKASSFRLKALCYYDDVFWYNWKGSYNFETGILYLKKQSGDSMAYDELGDYHSNIQLEVVKIKHFINDIKACVVEFLLCDDKGIPVINDITIKKQNIYDTEENYGE